MVTRVPVAVALGLALGGCHLERFGRSTGGTTQPAGACGRGLTVVESDYQSTNVALVDTRGRTLSGSFLSSGAIDAGLTAALGGDVVVATSPELGDDIAVLDRYPAAVMTLVGVQTGEVVAQYDVSSGFRSNPHDVARVGGELWLARYEQNPAAVPGCRGGDFMVVDRGDGPVGCLDLHGAMSGAGAEFQPHPARVVTIGNRLVALLSGYTADYSDAAPSRLALIDPAKRQLLGKNGHVLEGTPGALGKSAMYGCESLAVEPALDELGQPRARPRLVVGCTGRFHTSASATLDESGVVVLEIVEPTGPGDEPTFHELKRYMASELGGQPLGFDLDVDAGGRVLFATLGRESPSLVRDALVELDLDTGAHRTVLASDARAFVLGGVRCVTRLHASDPTPGGGAACSDSCFLADAEKSRLRRLVVGTSGYVEAEQITVETSIGLPPRWLGRF